MSEYPAHHEIEEALLGGIMQDAAAFTEAAAIVGPDDFHDQRNRMIFEAMRRAVTEHAPTDPNTLASVMVRNGDIAKVGGVARLTDLFCAITTAAHVPTHSRFVLRSSQLRELARFAQEAHAKASSTSPNDASEAISELQGALAEIAERAVQQRAKPMSKIDTTFCDDVEAGKILESGFKTGFHDIDRIIGGLRLGEYHVLAARPSIGKSLLAANMAEHIACHPDDPKPVLFFSLEMSERALKRRAVCSRANVAPWATRNGRCSDEDVRRLRIATREIDRANWAVHYQPAIHVDEALAITQRFRRKHGECLVVVDYLGLMTAPGESRIEIVSNISQRLMAMAGDLDVALLALSQLNRQSEHRPDRVPALSDLRDSGSIEQDAHIVMLLHRETRESRETKIYVAKNRDGATGGKDLVFDSHSVRFLSAATAEDFGTGEPVR